MNYKENFLKNKDSMKESQILNYLNLDISLLSYLPDFSLEFYRKVSVIPYAYLYMPKEAKEDKEIIINTLEKTGCLLKYCPAFVRKSRSYVYMAIHTDAFAVKYADEKLLSDRDFCKLVTDARPVAIQCFPLFWNDKEIMFGLCRKNRSLVSLLSPDLKKEFDKELESAFSHTHMTEDLYKEYCLGKYVRLIEDNGRVTLNDSVRKEMKV